MNFITKHLLLIVVSILLFASCSTDQNDPQKIIDRAINTHGGSLFEESEITFTFRDRVYTSKRKGGDFELTRFFEDASGAAVKDYLSNEGFMREVNGELVEVHDTMANKYSNSVNSVIYFALLPYKLNDPAVIKEYLGEDTIKGEPYHEIKVTFKQEGGGDDAEDVFVYWIHQENYTMDYLVYEYHVDGGGVRFREAKNIRTVGGIRFADYNNYGTEEVVQSLQEYDDLFEQDKLNLVSEIILEDVKVSKL